ncbi:MAG: SDR family oxidoreductase [Prolixibacteraceae bacterium]|nr:SDR family oxidoreductase [Prolixibacteraceae bacterium]
MIITIFGASGKTGHLLVEQALELGHQVRAFIRRENSLSIQHPKLKLVLGNLDNEASVRSAISGVDACISSLGGGSLRKQSTEITNGIQLITRVMEEENVMRFVYLSSIGVGESRYYMEQPIRFLIADLLLRVPLADHGKNEKNLMNSKLDWTIVRPGGLTNGPKHAQLQAGYNKILLKGNPTISRASVASFMLQQLTSVSYSQKAVWLYE